VRLQAAVLVTFAAFTSGAAFVFAAPSDSPSQAAQVDDLFHSWNILTSPGCAIAVMKDGRILYERGGVVECHARPSANCLRLSSCSIFVRLFQLASLIDRQNRSECIQQYASSS
jgi:CubicO group peptidase (beta-lactamase class C family)